MKKFFQFWVWFLAVVSATAMVFSIFFSAFSVIGKLADSGHPVAAAVFGVLLFTGALAAAAATLDRYLLGRDE